MTRGPLLRAALAAVCFSAPLATFADVDLPTKFSNRDSIGNTRHNMTQRQLSGGGPSGSYMDSVRNDYGEICVYCHTPHGANGSVTLPLWNRTIKATTYTTYDQLRTSTLTQTVSQPGPNSVACLTCHDGQTAVDSIINMPGSGGYNSAQISTQNNAFLNTWNNTRGADATMHVGLSTPECLSCHNPNGGVPGAGATDFTVFAIGTDLRNDHPVGVSFPATNGPGTDFNTPGGNRNGTLFFDNDGDGRMDPAEIRLYDSGQGAEVECASCHDPHGVKNGGGDITPSFLRVSNAGSGVCLTCHVK
jgi:hypothetical protein